MIQNWKAGIDYPDWMTEESLKTLQRQHLLPDETPREMYVRIVEALGSRLHRMLVEKQIDDPTMKVADIGQKWFNYLWKGWLCPATPILANAGTTRGFTISCFIERVEDSLDSIYQKLHEMGMLTKMGGGVGITFDKVRGRGEKISGGGFSEGIIPFLKTYDSGILAASQSNVRRGSASINLPVRHKDLGEFLTMRLNQGDVNRQCLNLNHCVTIDDFFMESVVNGDSVARDIWAKMMSSRMKSGQPYMMFYHNVNKYKPTDMVKRALKIDGTNICTEIYAPHDKDHTVVCDLASWNLVHWDAFKDDPEFVELSLLFLDCNLEEFIQSAKGRPGFDAAVRFAQKSRLLGLGVLGWHSLLQKKMIPFTSIMARSLSRLIGGKMQSEGDVYNKKWGKILGNPEWCDENRNIALFAFAPTTTNALVSGGVSMSVEPRVANAWVQKTAKGVFIRYNQEFVDYLKANHPEQDTPEFWNSLMTTHKGSVQQMEFLSPEAKEVFLTAYEINQLELVKSAAVWQKYVDQGISLNLFFPADVSPKWLTKVHLAAWEEGLKSLYYVRTESILSRSMNSSTFSDCVNCEG